MTDEPTPPSPSGSTPAADAEAARLLEVGLTGASGPPRRPAPAPSEIGAHFPELDLIEVLGQGGMGVVYKARQKKLDRLVALKVLPREMGEDAAFAERFAREARTLARLHHAHIVGVHEFGERDGLYYLVLEFVDGVTLRQVMAGGGLAPREALAIVPQICDALQYAHDQGVVHRDIKPENILLDRRGRVKVADFGLAKLAQPGPGDFTLTGTDQVMGTLHYMAPEQYKTPQEVDHRADIYSLGVVFYEMLTGDLPMGRFRKPSERQGIDARIDEIVMRSLERERELRYQRAEELNTAVRTVTDAPAPDAETREEAASGPRHRRHGHGRRHGGRHGRGEDGRPRMSRWARWALLSLPIGAALALLAYGFAYGVADGDTQLVEARAALAGWWAASGFGVISACLGVVAVIMTRVGRPRKRGFATAVLVIAAGLVGGTAPASAAVDQSRRLAWIVRARDDGRAIVAITAGMAVYGASGPASAEAIRRDIAQTWQRYLQIVRARDPQREDLDGLYDAGDLAMLRAMEPEEFEARRQKNALGMGLVGAATMATPPHRFQLLSIALDEWERQATVTAHYSRGAERQKLVFGMKRVVAGPEAPLPWVFAVLPVEISE